MSIYKLRVWPGALVILCLLAGLSAPAVIPGDNKAFAQSTDEPDLIIESISLSPEAPVIGDMVTFTMTIRNQGESQADSSLITYYINDIFLETDYVNQIGANTTITNTINWQAQAGSHTIKAVIDYDDRITEANETNNEKIYAFSVFAADLAIDEIIWTPENPSTGDTVTFTVTVTNRGNYRAAAFYVNLYIDGNPRIKQLVMPMVPGYSANVTYTWAALSGSHAVGAVADVLNQIDESNETNNYKMVNYATATPDLVIDPITWLPEARTESGNVTFTVTVRNQGSGTAANSLLAYYIDDVYQDIVNIGRLNPGATTTKTFSQVIGGAAHTFKAVADATDTLTETDDTNNTASVTLPALTPDLIIQSISWSPTTPLIAHNVIFTVTIKNQGVRQSANADLNFYVENNFPFQYRLSGISAGATATANFSWVTQSSSITIRAVVDEDNYINESNESNNTMSKTVAFATSSPTADLIIESITCTPENPSVDDTVTITAAIKNNGSGKASPSHVAYYIDDTLLNAVYVNSIEAGYTVTNTTIWPATAGTHTIRATADHNNSVSETNESNNEISAVISIPAPDLTIQSITWSPLVPTTGDDITFTLTIKNNGDLKASGSFVNYYIDNVYLGNHNIENIEPGATIIRTFTWKAQSESHTFAAIVDKSNGIVESDESNNEKTVVIPAPDLTIEGVTWSPVEPSESSTVTFMITVRNLGGSPANSPYLSCYIDDILQASLLINSIAAGSSAAVIFNWTAQSGEHVFKVIADGNDFITETDESNNEKVIDLSAPGAPMEAIPAPEPAAEAEPVVTTQINEPVESDTSAIETVEDLPTDNTTDEEDIAANIGDDSSSGWQDILMNKFIIFGAAGLGLAVIVVLLLLRRRSQKE